MARRRLINGALDGFLGSLVSRNSDVNGYWLLGFLAIQRNSIEIDLFKGIGNACQDLPERWLVELARFKYDEQLRKWRIPVAWVAGARLDVIWSREVSNFLVDGQRRDCYKAKFVASVTTDLGRTLVRSKRVFVAPHNPRLERRSTRAA
jgi:hypothetical protein